MSHDPAPDFGPTSPVPPPVPPPLPPQMPQLAVPPAPRPGFAALDSDSEAEADAASESGSGFELRFEPRFEPESGSEPAFAAAPAEPPPPFRINTRRSFRGRPRGDGGTGFVLSLLAMAAAGTLAFVSWPQLTAHLKSAVGPGRPRNAAATTSPEPDARDAPAVARRRSGASAERSPVAATTTTNTGEPRRDDQPGAAVANGPAAVDRQLTAGSPFEEPGQEFPPSRPASVPQTAPLRPPESPAGGPAAERPGPGVDAALRAAVRALRTEDWAAAGDRLDAAEAAADDDESAARVARWRRLLLYAEGFGPLRARALAASVGKEYTVDGKMISIVEANDTRFIFRRLGRNKSLPTQQIPRAIVVEIVTRWFAAADRPANDLFLGAYHACREEPNVPRARAAWQRASERGESAADELLLLLEDPALLAVDP